jgi:outer membrane lipoprotein carrier protein
LRRHRPETISSSLSVLAIAGLALLWGSSAAQEGEHDTGQTGVDFLRQFLDETQTLRATFHQELLGPDSEILELATGSLSIHRPGRFSWHYAQPIDQLVVADGSNLWIYDAELDQATVAPLDDAAPASPAMLLSGDATLDTEFDVLETFEAESLSWVRLAPKPSGTDFKEVLIGFRAGLLNQLRLLDSLDQVTTLEFFDLEINPMLSDTVFQFVPPPGVDVIGEAR